MKNPSNSTAVSWLAELAEVADRLPTQERPRPYWSQRLVGVVSPQPATLGATARRIRALILELSDEHFFAEVLGFSCVDDHGEAPSTPQQELERRVGKPHLYSADPESWTEEDLCDYIEVFHDLAARPTKGWHHSYLGCGWHPTQFSRKSGQALYRWRVNELLGSSLGLRLSESGEDVGRMVRLLPEELGTLVDEAVGGLGGTRDEIAHAVALFRSRSGTRQERRSAIIALAAVLEQRRSLLKAHLLSKDEGALFQIANEYDLRHRRADQRTDYGDHFLDWIFYWYLATIHLTDRIAEGES